MKINQIFFLKKKGYILLLIMILVSSIFILSMKVVLKNKINGTLVHLFYQKHNDILFLTEGISLVKAILAGEGSLIKNETKSESNSEPKIEVGKANQSEEKKNNKIQSDLSYFLSLYWLYANKWIHFEINDNIRNENRSIDIYLQFDDGKYPLVPLCEEFLSVKKKSYSQGEEKSEIQPEASNISLSSRKNEPKEDTESDKKIEEVTEKSIILQLYKKFIDSVSKKYSLLKNSSSGDLIEKEGESKLWQLLIQEIKDRKIFSFLEFKKFSQSFLFKIPVKEKEETMPGLKYCFSDIFSTENTQCALFYCSPSVLSLFAPKEFSFSAEERKNILQAVDKLLKNNSNDIKLKDLWTTIFGKTVKIDYPEGLYSKDYLEKIFTVECDFPQTITAYIKLTCYETEKKVRVIFKKNKKYTKKNEKAYGDFIEYLLESVYVL